MHQLSEPGRENVYILHIYFTWLRDAIEIQARQQSRLVEGVGATEPPGGEVWRGGGAPPPSRYGKFLKGVKCFQHSLHLL